MAIPDRPRCVATAVQIIKFLQLLKGIHTCPEAIVRVGQQLAFGDQPVERLFDEFLSIFDVFEDFATEYEEPAVDPRPGFGDLIDALHNPFPVDRNHMEARSRLDAHKAGRSVAPQKVLGKPIQI